MIFNFSDESMRIIPEDVLGIMRYTYVFKKHEKRDVQKKNFVYITPKLEFNCLLYLGAAEENVIP